MKKLLGWYAMPYVVLLYCMHEGLRFTYQNIEYDPRDFSYWGA